MIRMQAELERLKRQHAEREAQKQAERVAASAAASFSGRPGPAKAPMPAQGPPQMTEELLRTLKVLDHPCVPAVTLPCTKALTDERKVCHHPI